MPGERRLTARQEQILRDVASQTFDYRGHDAERPWLRPMDLGGQDASWHSGVMAQLVRHGLLERAPRGTDHSFVYRITAAGKAKARALRRVS